MPYYRRRRGYRLGLRRRRFGGMLRRRYGISKRRRTRYGMPRSLTVYRPQWAKPTVIKSDISVQDATIDVGGAIVNLFTAPASETNTYTLRYINWRCVLTHPATTGVGNPAIIRVILFVDKAGVEGSPPTVAGAEDGVLETATVQSSLNSVRSTAGRFVILSDKTFNFYSGANAADAAGTGNTAPVHRFYSIFKRLNFRIQGTGTVGINNQIYCLYLTSSDEVGAIDANARIGYVLTGQ